MQQINLENKFTTMKTRLSLYQLRITVIILNNFGSFLFYIIIQT